ncbi:kynurenine 3-monooxygenase [Rhodanobacter thiooxydans]|uniref:Kynurenine 3-monooxygenase n=1 Tax=Rhodanobacter thiooxydans TaxID=416169 RepID=A0A154QKX6_9GAMM|nr:NAD(P)/FAD-dependent oxidoreductase [Rhodanobacter thiooxydans]EIM01283.1 2-polyprenyl-6-methoxyphenol hydroxylase-like oxidoreductase [Rhodanobacter thiooxydans LCS2]KZC24800.1 kynurenine 3-monooxygenase [Rhodanobacter thiooxydans]MCW0202559.1 FAD-dependent monooxygenase [Rhodanobacter thiooxydans]
MAQQTITLIGGGLVGALLAQQLARRGFAVKVFEKRPDPRLSGFLGGRSINLALAERGLQALRSAGLADDVLQQAVMMRGRMVHAPGGHSGLQRYGVDDSEVIWSVSRGALNMLLLDAAEAAGASFHFGQSLVGANFGRQRIRLADEAGVHRERDGGLLIGADGAGSALRAAMNAQVPLGERIESLGHGYKELEIPPAGELPPGLAQRTGGREQFALEPHALHIWPRGGYMCIALPNSEGSFTVTLFLPAQGAAPSFASLPDAAAARAFFAADFPDLLPLIPRFDEDFDSHPVGTLSTLYLERWHLDGRALLVGDAAHAIVPFHGQGMNCGFEDTVVLADLLAAAPDDSAGVFAEFQRVRQPNADAIAAMALENYVEMRDSVADPHYLAKRELGAKLAERIPGHYMARYRLVTFTHVPYAYALERGRAQDQLLEQLLRETPNAAEVDLDAAARLFQAKLEPLPRLRHG